MNTCRKKLANDSMGQCTAVNLFFLSRSPSFLVFANRRREEQHSKSSRVNVHIAKGVFFKFHFRFDVVVVWPPRFSIIYIWFRSTRTKNCADGMNIEHVGIVGLICVIDHQTYVQRLSYIYIYQCRGEKEKNAKIPPIHTRRYLHTKAPLKFVLKKTQHIPFFFSSLAFRLYSTV